MNNCSIKQFKFIFLIFCLLKCILNSSNKNQKKDNYNDSNSEIKERTDIKLIGIIGLIALIILLLIILVAYLCRKKNDNNIKLKKNKKFKKLNNSAIINISSIQLPNLFSPNLFIRLSSANNFNNNNNLNYNSYNSNNSNNNNSSNLMMFNRNNRFLLENINNNNNINNKKDMINIIKKHFLFQNLIIPEFFIEKLKFYDNICSICLNVFIENKSKICVTQCHHVFHFYCLKKYVLENNGRKCPNCNYDLFRILDKIKFNYNLVKIIPLDEKDNPNNEKKNKENKIINKDKDNLNKILINENNNNEEHPNSILVSK